MGGNTIFHSAMDKLKLLGTLFLASSAAVTFYFVGIFSYVGIELMTLVDKQSLIEAILFYSALFSVTLAIATLLTAPFTRSAPIDDEPLELGLALGESNIKADAWTRTVRALQEKVRDLENAVLTFNHEAKMEAERWRRDLIRYCKKIIPAAGLASVLLVLWLLHLWKCGIFITVAVVLVAIAYFSRRFIYQLSLLAFFLLGFMRADFLMEATPSVTIIDAGDGNKPVEASIVLSSSRGIIAVVDIAAGGIRGARFLPWEKISRVEISKRAPQIFSHDFFAAAAKKPQCLPLKLGCVIKS